MCRAESLRLHMPLKPFLGDCLIALRASPIFASLDGLNNLTRLCPRCINVEQRSGADCRTDLFSARVARYSDIRLVAAGMYSDVMTGQLGIGMSVELQPCLERCNALVGKSLARHLSRSANRLLTKS